VETVKESPAAAWAGDPVRPTLATVDLGAIAHNVDVIRSHAPGAAVCAVVKADGYGHGAVPVARAAVAAGAGWLAVALVEEGEVLREAGIDAPILLLSEPLGQPDEAGRRRAVERLLAADLTPSVATTAFAELLRATAGAAVPAHLLVDTGMGRVGCRPDEVPDLLAHPGLRVTGAWTHFARADEDVPTTDEQLVRWGPCVDAVRSSVPDAIIHAANSAGALRHSRARLDMVRAGIALYGLSPAPAVRAVDFGLRQALTLRTGVSFVKRVTAGTPVAYGHTWSAPRDGWVATLPIGYADGLPRAASGRIEVLVAGVRHPQVGRVTMDQVLVFTGDREPSVGDEVVLLGGDAEHPDDPTRFVSVDEWAAAVDTISYEIPCQLTARVPRRHLPVT
jgi:alanine racemase